MDADFTKNSRKNPQKAPKLHKKCTKGTTKKHQKSTLKRRKGFTKLHGFLFPE